MAIHFPLFLRSLCLSSHSKTILVAPITSDRGLTPPPNLYLPEYQVKLVSNFNIPEVNKRSTKRRAEYGHPGDVLRHSFDVSRNRLLQESLYSFAFSTCMDISSVMDAPQCVLLDLACGTSVPFGGGTLVPSTVFKLGLDQIVLPLSGIDFVKCSLVDSRLPLRDSSVDFLISISFAQWVTASEDIGVIDLFTRECVRVLATKGGRGVLQFYPGNARDLDLICDGLVSAHPGIKGCRLCASPVKNRGLKIFVYFVKD